MAVNKIHLPDPAKEAEGKGIVEELMVVAENKREEITIILAGYRQGVLLGLFSSRVFFNILPRAPPHVL